MTRAGIRETLAATLGATLFGLVVGTVVASVLSTAYLLMDVSLAQNTASVWTLVAVPLLAFSSAMVWIALGAAMYLFAPALLMFGAYALVWRERWPGYGPGAFAAVFSLILFAPVFVFGYRSRLAEGVILAVSLSIGVRAGIRRLDNRLSGRGGQVRRLPRAVLLATAAVLTVVALAGLVLIVEWLRHPGGIGMEWLLVPIVGVTVLLCLSSGVALVRRGLKRPRSTTGGARRV